MVERHLVQALVAGSEGRGLKCRKEDPTTVPGMLDEVPLAQLLRFTYKPLDLSS
jgi:hypothetical protein